MSAFFINEKYKEEYEEFCKQNPELMKTITEQFDRLFEHLRFIKEDEFIIKRSDWNWVVSKLEAKLRVHNTPRGVFEKLRKIKEDIEK